MSATLILPFSTTGFAQQNITEDSLKTLIESKGDRVIMSGEKLLEAPSAPTGGISTMASQPLGLGTMYLYLVDGGGGLWWEGAHAVIPQQSIKALTESVSGTMYKKYSGSTTWSLTDSDAESAVNTYNGVYTETGENKAAKGSVGTTIRTETIGSLTTVLGNVTDSMKIDYVIK